MHPAAVSASINLEFLCLLPDSINSEAEMGLMTRPLPASAFFFFFWAGSHPARFGWPGPSQPGPVTGRIQ